LFSVVHRIASSGWADWIPENMAKALFVSVRVFQERLVNCGDPWVFDLSLNTLKVVCTQLYNCGLLKYCGRQSKSLTCINTFFFSTLFLYDIFSLFMTVVLL
jgi:hypothetical protein